MDYRVFVDANVLYPPSPRSLVLGAVMAGAAAVCTSEQVLDEVHRHLAARIRDDAAVRLEQVVRVLEAGREGAVVDLDRHAPVEPVGLPDPGDEHVVAGALAAGADGILTFNRKDFPEPLLARVGVELVDADSFFAEPLHLREPTWVSAVRHALTFPPQDVQTACDLGLRLHSFGLERTAGTLMQADW